MFLTELLDLALIPLSQFSFSCGDFFDPSSGTPVPAPIIDQCPFDLVDADDVCHLPSTFSPVASALATIGYYAQAYWIDQITLHHLQTFAIAIYILAGFWGLVSFVMGGRPQQYLWLFIGPPLFWWLVEQRTTIPGVNWMNGNIQQDQAEIFKRAEVGLFNDSYIQTYGFDVHLNTWPDGGDAPPDTNCGTDGACVSDFFAYLDYLISDLVRQLVQLLGVNNDVFRSVAPAEPTNLVTVNPLSSTAPAVQVTWNEIADHRWEFFSGISQARLQDPNISRMLATFLASECGDQFMNSIDKGVLLSTKNGNYNPTFLPVLKSNFIGPPPPGGAWQVGIARTDLWSKLNGEMESNDDIRELLVAMDMPPMTPASLLKTANRAGVEANMLYYASPAPLIGPPSPLAPAMDLKNFITCRDLFTLTLQGLRWEAAHIAFQLITSGPEHVDPLQFLAAMFQGWDIKNPEFIGPMPPNITDQELPEYVQAMVLAYLWRNELELSSVQMLDKQFITASEQSKYDMEAFQRNVNQKEKYGELYSWAKMLPHFQGNLLYFLAIAYPFAAMFVIAPGMGSVFVQWIQFFIWVKIWDVGFAIVNQLERTVWAVTGSTSLSSSANGIIYQLMNRNGDNVCSPYDRAIDIPNVLVDTYNPGDGSAGVAMIDRMLALMGMLDLDLSTTYYIYIMSALYMSVPAITGSLVLGAKAGMSSMLSSTMSGISSPIGRAAGSGAAGELSPRISDAQAIGSQEGFAKGAKGFASGALSAQNAQTEAGLTAGRDSYISQAIGTRGSAIGSAQSSSWSGNTAAGSGKDLGFAGLDSLMPNNPFSSGTLNRLMSGLGSGLSKVPGFGGVGQGLKGFADRASGVGGDPSVMDGSRGEGGAGGGGEGRSGRPRDGFLSTAAATGLNFGNNARIQGLLAEGVRTSAAGLDANRAASNSSMDRDLHGMQAGRNEAQAGYGGEMSAWRARSDLARGKSSTIAAMTGSAGSLNAGSMPTNMMGMAMSGKLGSENKALAHAAHAGGSLQASKAGKQAEMAGFNGAWAARGYEETTPWQATKDAAGTAKPIRWDDNLQNRGAPRDRVEGSSHSAQKDSQIQSLPSLGISSGSPGMKTGADAIPTKPTDDSLVSSLTAGLVGGKKGN